MTDKARLDEIRQRAEKATPEPWEHTFGSGDSGNNHNVRFGDNQNQFIARIVSGRGNGGHSEEACNANFIAHARSDIPWLLDRIEKLERLAGKVRLLKECPTPFWKDENIHVWDDAIWDLLETLKELDGDT